MKAEGRWQFRTGIVAMLAAGTLLGLSPCAADELPAYSLDLSQTTVSGISSGAFMAVQFGTAHAATVSGVAATAGGP
jgi:poly(3-hydroxybutyrate) depolymerase